MMKIKNCFKIFMLRIIKTNNVKDPSSPSTRNHVHRLNHCKINKMSQYAQNLKYIIFFHINIHRNTLRF